MPLREHKSGPPDPSTLLTGLRGIGRIPAERLVDEEGYWQGILELGGPLQMQTADIMLSFLDTSIGICKDGLGIPPHRRTGEVGRQIQAGVRGALGTLAMSQLLRRHYDRVLRVGAFGAGPGMVGMDLRMSMDDTVALVHHPLDNPDLPIGGVLEGYQPAGPRVDIYEDELLVVTAQAPADATTAFRRGYEVLTEGGQFVGANYVSLRPQLKTAYLQPPAAA